MYTTEFCKKTLLLEFGVLVNSLCNNYILGILRKKVPETLLFIVERLVQRDRMPAGVDWFPYLRVAFASFLSAAAGAQVVHLYYKPDLSIPETPPEKGELPKLRKMQQKGKAEEHHKKDEDKKEPQESSSEDGPVKKEDKPSAVS